MIKYAVMDFEDVQIFQKFKLSLYDKCTYIKLPRFFENIPKYCLNYEGYDYEKEPLPEFDSTYLRNAYEINPKGYENLNEYTFIKDNTECIVDYRE